MFSAGIEVKHWLKMGNQQETSMKFGQGDRKAAKNLEYYGEIQYKLLSKMDEKIGKKLIKPD